MVACAVAERLKRAMYAGDEANDFATERGHGTSIASYLASLHQVCEVADKVLSGIPCAVCNVISSGHACIIARQCILSRPFFHFFSTFLFHGLVTAFHRFRHLQSPPF